jgi:hypothetical protein
VEAERKSEIELREERDHYHMAMWNDEERQAFLTRSRDICDYMLPHASSLLVDTPSQADERWRHIFDTTATRALDTSVAGHMTYATPVGIGWLSLVLRDDPDLAKNAEVLAFTKELARRMISLAQQSNTEADFKLLTRDSLAFGGGLSIVDEDDKYTFWHRYVPVGDYAIGTSFRGQVDTMTRELRLTLRQAADEFGPNKLSDDMRRKYEEGRKNWEIPVHVRHMISPRKGGKRRSEDGTPLPSKQMAWSSVYWERDAKKTDGVLRESGYRVFPVLSPRYDVIAGGKFGYGPGCIALAHVRSLQHKHHRMAECIDWQTKGLFTAPTTAHGSNQWHPGGRVLSDRPDVIRNITDNNARLDHLQADILFTQQQIERTLYADTFTLLSSIDAKNVTAEAIAAKRQEKFDILGPLTARLLNEMPRPWVDVVYDIMEAKGLLPELPQVLLERRHTIDPEFESVLAKSAKTQKLSTLSTGMAMIRAASELDRRALHKFMPFETVNEITRTLDWPPEMTRSDDAAQEIADAEAAAQQQADATALGAERAKAIGALGGVSTAEPNLATAALGAGGPEEA